MKSENYILFIDESGKSQLSDQGKHFLLCGLIIDRDLHSILSRYMISLKERSNITTDENIHAFDLFEKEKVRGKRIPYKIIKEFLDRLLSLIEGSDIRYLIIKVDKTIYKEKIENAARKRSVSVKMIQKRLKEKAIYDLLYESLSIKMILEFGHFLESEKAQGEIVAESRRNGDEAVLKAFIDATHNSNFENVRYAAWSGCSFKRIHGLTFQNKKGLSFGLEIADLFAWAYYNKEYGREYPIKSKAQIKRVEYRLRKINKTLNEYCNGKMEDMTWIKIKSVANKKVPKLTKILENIS